MAEKVLCFPGITTCGILQYKELIENNRLELIKNMLMRNAEIDVIKESTNVDDEELKIIQSTLKYD